MKRIIVLAMTLCICTSLIGCVSKEERLNSNIAKLE